MRGLSPSALTAVAGISALIGSIKGLISFGNQMINVTSQFEKTQKGLETVLQSATKGRQMFEELRQFSFDTTFGIDELASASTQLLNVGVKTKELKEDLKMLGDLAQGDKTTFAELTSIFAKINATGKASAMQLNQIALRGIPLQQTLKQLGVTGTATAKDITNAFKVLTGEGGNFHDAMNNIIDTIEGKKGFISDTIKEILVNFGELSGITDNYKKILDTVYEILNSVNNKLREWNENPIMKAIIEGVLISSITAICGILVGSLIPALSTIVGLLSAINPTVMLGGVVGLLSGIGVSLATIIGKQSTLNEKLQEEKGLREDISRIENDKLIHQLENEIMKIDMDMSAIEILSRTANDKRKTIDSWEKSGKVKRSALEIGASDMWDSNNSKSRVHNTVTPQEQEYLKAIEDWNKAQSQIERYLQNNNVADIEELKKIKDAKWKKIQELQKLGVVEESVDEEVVETVKKSLKSFDSIISESFEKSFTDALNNNGNVLDGLVNGFKGITSSSFGVTGGFTMIVQAIQQLIGAFHTYLTELDNANNSDVMNPFERIVKHFKVSLESFIKITQDALDSFNEFLTIIDEAQNAVKPLLVILRAIFSPLRFLTTIITNFITSLQKLGQRITNIMSFGLFDWLSNIYDSTMDITDAQQTQAEKLRELNKQYEDLMSAMKEQEEYYYNMKKQINSDSYTNSKLTNVNDMILSPHGNFSTDPNDFIIATKNPSSLGGSSVVMIKPIINNNASDSVGVEVTERTNTDGMKELIVNISRQIASDYAGGKNGWDNAYAIKQSKLNGRSVIS